MNPSGVAPRDMNTREFSDFLVALIQREGWSESVKRTISDWLYERTGRTV